MSAIKLKIDNREGKCKDLIHLENVEIIFENLIFGDFQILIDDKIELIFERKTLEDLLASIKDGRYKNQKINIRSNFDVRQYFYIIEGNVTYSSKTTNIQSKILQSAIINTQLRDKIGMFFTKNCNETCELIMSIYNRVKDSPVEYVLKKDICLNNDSIEEKQIVSKKVSNVNECWKQQLCAIPNVSSKTADAIMLEFSDIRQFFTALGGLSKEECIKRLEQIKTKDDNGKFRKISSKIVQNIINYVLFIDTTSS